MKGEEVVFIIPVVLMVREEEFGWPPPRKGVLFR